jgi:hypothetical protein
MVELAFARDTWSVTETYGNRISLKLADVPIKTEAKANNNLEFEIRVKKLLRVAIVESDSRRKQGCMFDTELV